MALAEITHAASNDKSAKFVDLKDGGYVDESKYAAQSAQLTTAKNTIAQQKAAIDSFGGRGHWQPAKKLAAEKKGEYLYEPVPFQDNAMAMLRY